MTFRNLHKLTQQMTEIPTRNEFNLLRVDKRLEKFNYT